MIRILIQVKGGIVQQVFSTSDKAQVEVLDHDNPSLEDYGVEIITAKRMDEIIEEETKDWEEEE